MSNFNVRGFIVSKHIQENPFSLVQTDLTALLSTISVPS